MPRRSKGTGGIRNRGTERTPRYFPYYYRTVNGKRLQVIEGPFTKKKDAERWLGDQLELLSKGRAPLPNKMDVGEMLDEWLTYVRPQVTDGSWREYSRHVEQRLKPELGDLQLVDLGPRNVVLMIQRLRRPGSNLVDPSKAISERTIQYIYSTLHTALSWAVGQQLIISNPLDGLDRPGAPKGELNVFSAEQLAVFLEEASHERLGALWRLAAATGMRRGELIGLRWSEVDLKQAMVTVVWNRTPGANNEIDERRRTKSDDRVVDIDPDTVAALREWRRQQAAEQLQAGGVYSTVGHVFTGKLGGPLHPSTPTHWFAEIRRRRPELPKLSMHGLRHTHASLLLNAGVPPIEVAYRLGDSVTTILGVYAHFIPGQGQRSASTFAAALAGSAGDHRDIDDR